MYQWSEKVEKKRNLIEFEPYLLKIAVFRKALKSLWPKTAYLWDYLDPQKAFERAFFALKTLKFTSLIIYYPIFAKVFPRWFGNPSALWRLHPGAVRRASKNQTKARRGATAINRAEKSAEERAGNRQRRKKILT